MKLAKTPSPVPVPPVETVKNVVEGQHLGPNTNGKGK